MLTLFKRGTRRQRRRRNHILIALGVGLLLTAVAVLLRPFASFEWRLEDLLFLPTSPSPNIVIAAIDDATLSEYGKWSEWPRSLHVQAIDNLSAAGAMVIGFDVLFADESTDDPALAQAIADAGNVVLAEAGNQQIASSYAEVTFEDILQPAPTLAVESAALGHGNVVPDGDGVMRRIPLVVRDADGASYPALTVACLYTHFSKALPSDYAVSDGVMHLLRRDIPVDAGSMMRVNFVGDPGTYPRLSYADVIEGTFDSEQVKFNIVLVGMTATGEPDSWVTPVSAEKMYGVEIHANAMDTILRQRYMVEVGWSVTLLTLLAFVLVTGIALPCLGLRWGGLLTALLFAGYLVGLFFAFDNGYVLNILYPLLVLPVVFVTVVLCRITAEQSDRSQVKDLFGRYVSSQVAGRILHLAESDELHLGGEKREVTALFADIRGFTSISEHMSPESLVAMLNTYLSVIIDKVLANDGMINKFAGDSIMAVWNAPHDQSNHALLAVKAALESQAEIVEMRGKDTGLPAAQFGIGVNSGEAVAGNMGSEGRTEYTVIGDAVNVASRLCSNAPGGEVWIGPLTYEQVEGRVEVVALEPQQLKGKGERVPVYQALRVLS